MRTGNPTLREDVFTSEPRAISGGTMTIQGAVSKTAVLLVLALMTASISWFMTSANPGLAGALAIAGALGGFVVAIILAFKHTFAPALAPVYALLEGLFLGAISAIFEKSYPGIVVQAIALTFGTLFALLAAYQFRLIRATENFKLGVFAATGAIALFYLVSMVLGFFGISVPMIHQSGPIGIAFSVFVVIIAALNLVLDFDFIESGEDAGAPKYMEWYAAFGLLVTLVWLYIEILRLLAKLQKR